MNLEKVSVALRPRNPWEAIDLGVTLARANARVVWGSWFAAVLPVHALLWLVLGQWPGLVFLLLWWLKPLFDRVPLIALSQLLFGGAPTPLGVLKSLPKALGPHRLRSLTWSRFNPIRAVILPIWQLEGLAASELSRRQRTLTRGADAGALGLMMVCGMLELCLTVAGTGLIMQLAPTDLNMDLEGLLTALLTGEAPLWYTLSTAVSWTLAHTVAEVLYVAGGFGLYINRRTWLEGWDIELQLRRLAQRLGAAAALLLALGLGAPRALAEDTGLAAPPPPPSEMSRYTAGPPVDAPALKDALERVLALPEMPHERKETSWKLKGEDEPELDIPNFSLGPLAVILGTLLKIVVIALVSLGIFVLIRAIMRARSRAAGAEEEGPEAQRRLPALLRDQEPLPDDVVAQARIRWRDGRRAEALGLLYRGALRHLVIARGMAIPDGATESDCLRLLGAQLEPAEGAYFSTLTLSWQAAAYAHSFPEDDAAISLMDQWSRWYREVT